METLMTGTVNNINQTISSRRWINGERFGVNITTSKSENGQILILTNETTQEIIQLPIKDWQSLVVFMAESFALAELDVNNKRGEVKITLTVDKETL